MHKNTHAFSLVELSIVLVILGLLTGGILAGQNLIRAAELRSITTDYSSHITAVNTFRDKYFALPGDFDQAEDFWGTRAAGDAACKAGASTNALTCNGDGNGRIQDNADRSNELFRFWQHLANAGLIEGTYTGVAGSGSSQDVDFGVNAPPSRYPNAGFSTRYQGTIPTGFSHAYEGDYQHVMFFGTEITAGNYTGFGAALAPEDAWNIDTKLDDGLPAQGVVVAPKATSPLTPGCTTSDAMDAEYAVSDPDILCSLVWRRLY